MLSIKGSQSPGPSLALCEVWLLKDLKRDTELPSPPDKSEAILVKLPRTFLEVSPVSLPSSGS